MHVQAIREAQAKQVAQEEENMLLAQQLQVSHALLHTLTGMSKSVSTI